MTATKRLKYHGGFTKHLRAESQTAPVPLTCRDTGAVKCPRGDLNPHAQ